MPTLTKNEIGQVVFEPVQQHRFTLKIPGIPTHMVKSYSDLTWRDFEDTFELDAVHIELWDVISPSTKKIVYDNIICRGNIIPEIFIEFLTPPGDITQTITLKNNTVIFVDMGRGSYEDNDKNVITIAVTPKDIAFS